MGSFFVLLWKEGGHPLSTEKEKPQREQAWVKAGGREGEREGRESNLITRMKKLTHHRLPPSLPPRSLNLWISTALAPQANHASWW